MKTGTIAEFIEEAPMLRGIDPIISPSLIEALMAMGHGDEIVFADSNFPSSSQCRRTIYCCGHRIPRLVRAILPLFPLDYAVDYCGILMQTTPLYPHRPVVWEMYRSLFDEAGEKDKDFLFLDKPAFYERARNAYAVVATGEAAPFSNLIIRKGIIVAETSDDEADMP